MKKYNFLSLFLAVLLLTVFVPITHYKILAETENEVEHSYKTSTEKEVETGKEAHYKTSTIKKVKKSKVKNTKKAKITTTAKVSTIKTPAKSTTASSYSAAVVATHNSATSCWTIIAGNVYDLTSWINQHPGGSRAILSLCGIDGTQAFNNQHGGQGRPEQELKSFLIGIKS